MFHESFMISIKVTSNFKYGQNTILYNNEVLQFKFKTASTYAFQMERLNLSSNRIGDRGMWKLYRSIHNIDFLDVSWCRISASCKDDVRSRLVRDEFSVRHVKG